MLMSYRQRSESEYLPQEVEQIEQQEVEKAPKKRTFILNKKQKAFIIGKIVFISILAMGLIMSFSNTSLLNFELIEIEKQIATQKDANSVVEQQLSQLNSMVNVQTKAAELNMRFPSKEQTVYLKLVPYEQLVQNNKNAQENNANAVAQDNGDNTQLGSLD